MSADTLIAEALKLSPQDRLRIAEALWNSAPDENADFPVREELQKELERRFADYEANPEAGSPWNEVQSRLHRQLFDHEKHQRHETM